MPAGTLRGGDFNPRSPCGERRPKPSTTPSPKRFQSTLPVWGATAERLRAAPAVSISIHAPRVGSDVAQSFRMVGSKSFQSTLPVWGATATFCSFVPSIASLLCSQSPIGQFHQQNSAAYPETTRNSVRTHRVASVCHLLALTTPGSLQGRSPALHRSVLLCHASYSRGGKCGRCLFPCS